MRPTIISIIFYMMFFHSSHATPTNNQAIKSSVQCSSGHMKKTQQCKKVLTIETDQVTKQMATALSLVLAKKFKAAFNIYLPLAESGNVGAQFNVAGMYGRGEGVPLDYELSFSWYEKAALKGDAMSQYFLGVFYMKGLGTLKDLKKGFYWTEQSASQGYKYAQSNLGMHYAAGGVIGRDHNKAIVWHRKAAEQGVADSQYYTAFYYCIGFEAAPKNLKTCAKWAKKAQKNGSKRAAKLWERYELWKFY